MKYTLEIPDQDNEFVLEFLRRVTSVKLTPIGRKPKPKDETEYLLSNPANAKALLDAIERLERGEGQQHDLLEV
ncbi:MAG: type II toxin-antitoxin system Phd/YefM family antitoxin [Janthinobacterium lividum]